ncbi:MAG: terminase [Deltaproteobacteria bacterium]|nr:MAG: terminase [Deltaproteobacteria bacterium]
MNSCCYDQAALEISLIKKSLHRFAIKAWEVVEPATEFIDNWHIQLICEYLEAVSKKEIKKLVINMPPRHMKSLCVSVFWPVWEWLQNPASRFVFASYSGNLAIRDSLKCRRIIESPWFQRNFGNIFKLTTDQNVKSKFENDKTGVRLCTSVGGGNTGEGGDYVCSDDPHNLKEIHSDLIREGVIRWWKEVIPTRTNDPKKSAKVIVMQRGHQKDLSGYVLKEQGYTHLNIKGVAKKKTFVEFPKDKFRKEKDKKSFTREEGHLLCEKRFSQDDIDELKMALGANAFAAQIQQEPSPDGGAIFKRKYWRYYNVKPNEVETTIQSWDTAFKAKKENDYSVCITMVKAKNGYYLLDLWRDRLEFPELKRQAVALYEKFSPDIVLIEDKASGQSLIQEMQRDTVIPIIPIKVDTDKISRAHSVSPTCEAGNVFLPEKGNWLADFLEECEFFPNSEHDDQVDALTQAINYFLGFYKGYSEPRIRSL